MEWNFKHVLFIIKNWAKNSLINKMLQFYSNNVWWMRQQTWSNISHSSKNIETQFCSGIVCPFRKYTSSFPFKVYARHFDTFLIDVLQHNYYSFSDSILFLCCHIIVAHAEACYEWTRAYINERKAFNGMFHLFSSMLYL